MEARRRGSGREPDGPRVGTGPIHLLLVSGSLRSGSTNTSLLRTAAAVAPAGISTTLYGGLADLPHFNPDDDAEGVTIPTAVAAMRAQLDAADAILFSTPEYAGALPGSFKNLLEWSVGGHEIYETPVAWVNAAGPAAPTGAADAHDSLRKVLGYVGANLVEDACVRIPVSRDAIGPDGLIADPELRTRLVAVLETLATHAKRDRPDGGRG
jgi:chromate reductase